MPAWHIAVPQALPTALSIRPAPAFFTTHLIRRAQTFTAALLFALLLALAPLMTTAPAAHAAEPDQPTAAPLRAALAAHVHTLSQVIGPRHTGAPKAYAHAARYIADVQRKAGIHVQIIPMPPAAHCPPILFASFGPASVAASSSAARTDVATVTPHTTRPNAAPTPSVTPNPNAVSAATANATHKAAPEAPPTPTLNLVPPPGAAPGTPPSTKASTISCTEPEAPPTPAPDTAPDASSSTKAITTSNIAPEAAPGPAPATPETPPAATHQGPALLLCAHYDSVPGCPGAGDNASGVAVLLETARALARRPPPTAVDIAFFPNEEEPHFMTATSGSVHYAALLASRRALPALAVAVDTVGWPASGPRAAVRIPSALRIAATDIVVGARPPARAQALALAHSLGCETMATDVGALWLDRSDHAAFAAQGVPAALVAAWAGLFSPLIHSPQDTPQHLDFTLLENVVLGLMDFTRRLGPGAPWPASGASASAPSPPPAARQGEQP